MINSHLDEKIITPILNNEEDFEGDESIATILKEKLKRPKLYKVILHNDDYTTMEFVVFILQSIFNKNLEEANKIMLNVHKNGHGICGVYTFEIAETKSQKVMDLAKEEGHPLLCTIEVE